MADQAGNDIQMDAANLYREESYTDLKAGSLRKLVPVKADGTDDPSRPAIFSEQLACERSMISGLIRLLALVE